MNLGQRKGNRITRHAFTRIMNPATSIVTAVTSESAAVFHFSREFSKHTDPKALAESFVASALTLSNSQSAQLLTMRGGSIRTKYAVSRKSSNSRSNSRPANLDNGATRFRAISAAFEHRATVLARGQSSEEDDTTHIQRMIGEMAVLCIPLAIKNKPLKVLCLEQWGEGSGFDSALVTDLTLLSFKFIFHLQNINLHLRAIREANMRKTAERAAREKDALIDDVERICHIGHWVWDFGTDEINASAEFCRILGIPASSRLHGSHISGRIHQDDLPRFQRSLEAVVRHNLLIRGEFRVVLPEGAIRYLQWEGHPGLCDRGAQRYIGTVFDVTDRKSDQNALRIAQSDLKRAQRFATIGELGASISTRFRSR